MYDFGCSVYCKSQDRVGTVEEREYLGRPRRASYLVVFGPGDDFLTGADDLRAADWSCDGCGRHLPLGSKAAAVRGPDGVVEAEFCFLCKLEGERDYYGTRMR